MNISLDAMIEATFDRHPQGKDALEGMQAIHDRYKAGDFYGISNDCADVVRIIQDVFACDYFAASRFFAAEMRNRYQINVD